jgi:hypothetical protein
MTTDRHPDTARGSPRVRAASLQAPSPASPPGNAMLDAVEAYQLGVPQAEAKCIKITKDSSYRHL